MKFEAVIGLEVHAQLLTSSKVFCGCSTVFGNEPNAQTCPVCLGLPGALPVLNRKAVEFAVKMGLATNCEVATRSIFARKNYFYPDLPKGYQISQFEEPLCRNGYVEIEIDGRRKRIGIERIHLEEDAGKSIHAETFVAEHETLVDLNRCGVPLIEIVSCPDIASPSEATVYLKQLRQVVRYLEICDGNMEEGSLRCDANVSVRPEGTKRLGVKTEVKNMNSFRSVQRALEFEIKRQSDLLRRGGEILQETLLWDESRYEAVPMRGKEGSPDYRYFPEPDLLPLRLPETWVTEIRNSLPELPFPRKERFMREYALPRYDAEVLTEDREIADFFEKTARHAGDAKAASNWIMGEVLRVLKEKRMSVGELRVTPEHLGSLIKLIAAGTVSGKMAKTVFEQMVKTGDPPEEIVREKGLVQISDAGELSARVEEILHQNEDAVGKFLAGKEQIFGFLVGQVMKATRGKANPKMVNELLRNALEERRKQR